MSQDNITIVARATAPYASAISVIRLSGEKSHAIAKQVTGKITKTRYASLVTLCDAHNNRIDQGIQIMFRSPHSYTGEDMVEWHCHGSVLVGDVLLATVIALGARMAQPGEFTQRAFLNDKIDLHQAQAVANLIAATSKRHLHVAASSLAGNFSHTITDLSAQIDWCRGQIEAHLDFSDEAITPADLESLVNKLRQLHQQIQTLITKANNNLAYVHSPKVVLLGAPNTGKSSVFNCLLNDDRALVSAQAGTTRDLLREHFHCGDISIHLCDSAGIRHSDDAIEQAGVTRTFEQLAIADIVLFVFDATQNVPIAMWQEIHKRIDAVHVPQAQQKKQICLIANKIDLMFNKKPRYENYHVGGVNVPCIWLSALQNKGVDLLLRWLRQTLEHEQKPESGDAFLIHNHHKQSLVQAAEDIASSIHFVDMHNLELCAEHVRLARLAIDELTGRSASDALLGDIFSKFCIGK